MATADVKKASKASVEQEEVKSASSHAGAARWAMFVALGAAWVAMCGSLFMSEALGWIPCQWCWIQRIFMYPTAINMAVGLINKDRNTPKFALALAVPGALASVYHILLQKWPWFSRFETCTVGVPCSSDYLNWFGFITIPMLALTAFVIIIVCAVIALRATRRDATTLDEAPTSIFSVTPSVLLVVLTIVALFVVVGVVTKSRLASAAAPTTIAEVAHAGSTTKGATQERAAVIYTETCQSCHGPANNGMLLVRRDYIESKSDIELMSVIRAGRSKDALDTAFKQTMPANGGRISLSDDELVALVRYLRAAIRA